MSHHQLSLIAVCLFSLVLGTRGTGAEVVIDSGTWEPVVPLRQELFSVAVGLQIAGVQTGDPPSRQEGAQFDASWP